MWYAKQVHEFWKCSTSPGERYLWGSVANFRAQFDPVRASEETGLRRNVSFARSIRHLCAIVSECGQLPSLLDDKTSLLDYNVICKTSPRVLKVFCKPRGKIFLRHHAIFRGHHQVWTRNQWYLMKWSSRARILMDFRVEARVQTTVAPSSRRVRSQTKYLGLSAARAAFIFYVFISSRLPQHFQIGFRKLSNFGFGRPGDVSVPNIGDQAKCIWLATVTIGNATHLPFAYPGGL